MPEKFDIRLVYLAIALALIWSGVVVWKAVRVIAFPMPAILDLSEHGSTLHFEADRTAVLFADDCVNVSWQVENIRSVQVDNQGRIGQGTDSSCGRVPTVSVQLKDGSTKDYPLPHDVAFGLSDFLITLAVVGFASYTFIARWLVVPDNSAPAAARTEIRPLTSLRGLAALLVFFFHWNPFADGTISLTLADKGLIGVSIFFVLSGFLIASRYMDEVLTQTFRWRAYMVRRAARILPLYYFILLIVVIWQQPINLANLTLTQALFPTLSSTGISVGWSLTVEESFYLLLPLILWLCWRTKRPWLALAVVLVIAYSLGRVAVWVGIWPTAFMLTRTIFGRMINFVIGVGCAFLYRRWRPGSRAGLLTLLCCVGLIVWALLLGRSDQDNTLIYGDWLAALFAGGLILSLTARTGLIVRLAGWRPFVYAGRISYAVYLLQFIAPVKQLQMTLLPVFGVITNLVLYTIVTVICIGLYELVEKPAHRWILHRFSATGSAEAAGLRPTQV